MAIVILLAFNWFVLFLVLSLFWDFRIIQATLNNASIRLFLLQL
jgi:hypothetical protein